METKANAIPFMLTFFAVSCGPEIYPTGLSSDLIPMVPDELAACSNGVKDNKETDTDCGGNVCGKCTDEHLCLIAEDCASALCMGQFCTTQPAIQNISPDSALITSGVDVTITGTGFDTDPASIHVTFGSLAATVKSASRKMLVVQVPAAAMPGAVDVAVVNGNGTSFVLAHGFSYVNDCDPNDFSNSVALPINSVLNADVIVNRGASGLDQIQDAIDSPKNMFDMMTQFVASKLFGPTAVGLPNDGFFKQDNNHPDLTLMFNDNDDGNNASLIKEKSFIRLSVPNRPYRQLQLYVTAADSPASVDIKVEYSDGNSDEFLIQVPAWSQAAPQGMFTLIGGLNRTLTDASGFDSNAGYSIFGVRLRPSSCTKKVDRLTISNNRYGGNVVLFGGMGW